MIREYSPSSQCPESVEYYLSRYRQLSQRARNTLKVYENLSYGDKRDNILDLFPPVQRGSPLVVFIHGGYWQETDHKTAAMMAENCIASGYGFAALHYTLAPEGSIDEMIGECEKALFWLAQESATYGFFTANIRLIGHSAGAHLVAMMLTRSGKRFQSAGVRIDKAILISGIYDLRPILQTPVNGALGLLRDDIEPLSPIYHLPPKNITYEIVVSEHDTTEFIRQSFYYAELLRCNGYQARFRIVGNHNHFDVLMADNLI
ncbi:alpha/beta hydrolase [Parendozoicomonas haliclonae]|uniref:alpha/beta hydrolase n=1 Tax=Parendozoicomonas haliclonae TaxID=1960125 RepID=UPI0013FDB369|nr:alpha/beta hydrolase [Parendozoicomonas haliclonae]